MPSRHKPIGNTDETLQNRYDETMSRLQKIKDAVCNVVLIWWCEFRKLLRHTPGLENELCSHPVSRSLPLIFVMPCTGVEPRLLKHITKSK